MQPGVQVSLWKRKGDKTDPNTYRGIVLLPLLTRVMAKLLATRLRTWTERFLSPYQFGFRPNRGTDDILFIVRRVHEECRVLIEGGSSRHFVAALLDLLKAYPKTSRPTLWATLESRGMNAVGPCMRVLRGMHELTEYVCRVGCHESKPYRPQRGTREGCPSSPVLFNTVHDAAMATTTAARQVGRTQPVGIPWRSRHELSLTSVIPGRGRMKISENGFRHIHIPHALFADDITQIGEADEMLGPDGGIERTSRALKVFHETEHAGKREVGRLGDDSDFGQQRLLGVWLDNRRDSKERVNRGWKAWFTLKNRLRGSKLAPREKASLVEIYVRSTMVYGAKTRTWLQRDFKALEKVLSAAWRFITGLNKRRMQIRAWNMADIRAFLGDDRNDGLHVAGALVQVPSGHAHLAGPQGMA